MAKLTIKDDSGRERAFLLTETVTMAGRASTNAIQINDDKSSRQHFKIEHREDGYYVVDLGSTNGTRLNGMRLGLPTLLLTGDVISVGKFALTFSSVDSDDAALPTAESVPHVEPSAISPEKANKPTLMSDDVAAKIEKPVAVQMPTQPSGPIYVLRILEGSSAGRIFELGNEPLTLGRHASNTIQIEDEAASNYHAEVVRESVGFVVSDLGSTNGTKVRNQDHSDFEKVVKSPLKVGMQIKIGKTLLEFQNIGAPAADEEGVYNERTVSDPANPHGIPMSSPPSSEIIGGGSTSSGMGAKIGLAAAALVAVGLGVYFVPGLVKGSGGPGKVATTISTTEQAKPAANLVMNSSFDLEIDDEGYPKEFQVQKGSPEAVISVNADAERPGEKTDAQKHGLQISKGDAKSLLKPTVVESRDPISIDAAKAYEVSAWMRNDGDGIYGMRITWLDGDRALAENPIVVKGSQGWGKEARSATVTPPVWASRARIGVFVQGKSGKASFDDLSFKEKSAATVQRPPSVKNNGIVLQFEGAKGAFSVTSQGKGVLEDGTLRLEATESKAASDLSSAFKPAQTKGNDSGAGFEGKLFDFAQQDFASFTIAAKPGASGVDLTTGLEIPQESSSKPVLRFYVAGNAATGEIEIAKADASVSRLQGTEDKDDSGIKSILFNAGKSPQFDLLFGKPATVRLKREGKRRLVEIRFDGELLVSFAPEDVLQKQEMLAAAADLKKASEAKEWSGVETKLKSFNEKYAAKFPQAQEEATKAKEAIDSAWNGAKTDFEKLLNSLQNAATPDLLDKARQANQRLAESWKGSEKAPQIADMLAQIDAIGAKALNADAEKKAEEAFMNAQKNFDAGNFEVAASILQVSILDNAALAATKVAEKAKELLPKAAAAGKRQKDINIIQDNLRAITKNYIAQKNYKEAIKVIETDPEYNANKADLKEIQALLADWKKKAGM